MPFLDSKTIRPLYDVLMGGSPKAFLCMFCSCGGSANKTCVLAVDHTQCHAVTKTYRGMVDHLRYKHQIVLQHEMNFENIKPTAGIE